MSLEDRDAAGARGVPPKESSKECSLGGGGEGGGGSVHLSVRCDSSRPFIFHRFLVPVSTRATWWQSRLISYGLHVGSTQLIITSDVIHGVWLSKTWFCSFVHLETSVWRLPMSAKNVNSNPQGITWKAIFPPAREFTLKVDPDYPCRWKSNMIKKH